jgi:biotin carboxyl carrier protein
LLSTISVPCDGTVVDIAAVAGKQIAAGDLIMVLELQE